MVDTGESLCNSKMCKAKIKCTAIITLNLSRALLCVQINNIKEMKRGREEKEGGYLTVGTGAGKLAAFTPQNSCQVDGANKEEK